jgi:NAD(P)-dependent dehydrogenase (short-subunit alcohol dehydrogenase family)
LSSFVARAARGSYSASKFAIEAIHESLAQEVQVFGIKVLIVQPGAFRTPFAETIVTPTLYSSNNGVSDAYMGTAVEEMVSATRNIMSLPGVVRGDPQKAAKAILNAVDHGGFEYLRLPLGPDCVSALEGKIQHLQKDLDSTRSVSMGTDLD